MKQAKSGLCYTCIFGYSKISIILYDLDFLHPKATLAPFTAVMLFKVFDMIRKELNDNAIEIFCDSGYKVGKRKNLVHAVHNCKYYIHANNKKRVFNSVVGKK